MNRALPVAIYVLAGGAWLPPRIETLPFTANHPSDAMGKPTFGTCQICGTEGKLSFEHVPPESAYNDQKILRTAFEKMLQRDDPDDMRGGRYQQRGAGAYTLCERCNNTTGHWYGGAYLEWASQAMNILLGTPGKADVGIAVPPLSSSRPEASCMHVFQH